MVNVIKFYLYVLYMWISVQHLELVERFLWIKIDTKLRVTTPVSVRINSNSRKSILFCFLCLCIKVVPTFQGTSCLNQLRIQSMWRSHSITHTSEVNDQNAQAVLFQGGRVLVKVSPCCLLLLGACFNLSCFNCLGPALQGINRVCYYKRQPQATL